MPVSPTTPHQQPPAASLPPSVQCAANPVADHDSAELHAALELLDSPDLMQKLSGESRLVRLGNRITPRLLDLLSFEPWGPRSAGVLEVFKQTRPAQAAPVVLALLNSTQSRIRLAALRTLRWLSVDMHCFIQALGDAHWEIRKEAVFCLSGFRQANLLLPLAGALRDDHYQVRAAAANVLGMLGIKDALPLLCAALRDESQRVKAMAAWSLKHWHDPKIPPFLLEALPTASGEAKGRILHALKDYSSPAAVAALLKSCGDCDDQVRATAAAALGAGSPRMILDRLMAFLRFAPKEVAHKSAWTVATHGVFTSKTLMPLLNESNETMRYFATCALGYLNLQSAHDRLLDLAEQEQQAVRRATARGLKLIQNKRLDRPGPSF